MLLPILNKITLTSIPENVIKLINDPKVVKVLSTKSPEGIIHTIPVGSIIAPSPNTVTFASIWMNNTSKNLEEMKKKNEMVSIVVISGMEAYQVKGLIKDYKTSGPIFDKITEQIKKLGLTVKGVWTLEPKEIWNQSASDEAGKKIV